MVDAFVLPEAAYDMVIGMDWLEKFSPMLCAWDRKWVEFTYEGEIVRLQGLNSSKVQRLQEISCEQVSKWHRGNEIWTVDMLQIISNQKKVETQMIPLDIQQILDKFERVFKNT